MRTALFCLLTLLALGFTLAVSMARLSAKSNPDFALKILPNNSTALLVSNLNALSTRGVQPDSLEIIARADQVIRHAPLSSGAYIQKASLLYGQDNQDEQHALFTAGQIRQPRSLAAANGLFTLALSEHNYQAAIAQIDLMFRLSDGNTGPLFDILGRFTSDPDFQTAIAEKLAEKPNWRHTYLHRLLAKKQDLDIVYALIDKAVDSDAPSKDDIALQNRVVANLVRGGDVYKAKAYWDRYNNISAKADAGLVFDPEFKDRQTPPPFNWKFHTSKFSKATELSGGGVRIDYAGDRPANFLQQIVFIKPGQDYTLSLSAAGDLKTNRGSLQLFLRCYTGNALLAQMEISALSGQTGTFSQPFSLPPGACDVQKLFLRGEPGPYSVRYFARITNINILPSKSGHAND